MGNCMFTMRESFKHKAEPKSLMNPSSYAGSSHSPSTAFYADNEGSSIEDVVAIFQPLADVANQ